MTVEPAFAVPPHIRHGAQDELHAWFTDPPGAVLQLSKPQRATLEQARWLVGPAIELLRARFPVEEKVIIVLDYRNMTSRDTSARTLMMEHAGEFAHMFSHVYIVPPLQANPVYRSALHAAIALVSVFGSPLEIVETLDEVIAKQSLRALRS